MEKITIGALAVSFVLLGAGCGADQVSVATVSASDSSGASSAISEPSAQAPQTVAYTLDDIAKHSTKEDCWAAIDGQVYDLTQAIDKHPGGAEAMLKSCGKDGTDLFSSIKDGKGHPQKAQENLKNLLVGILK